MPLLTDPDRAVAKAYGVVGAFGLRRSVFFLDADGLVFWRGVSTTNVRFPSAAEIKDVVARCTGLSEKSR